MTIQINSDNNITGTEGLSNFVESTVAETLKRKNVSTIEK